LWGVVRAVARAAGWTVQLTRAHASGRSSLASQASFDGRNRVEVPQGAAVRIRASEWAVPTVCVTDATLDWFDARRWRARSPSRRS